MTWNDEVRFGPPLPTNSRIFSPDLGGERLVADERADRAVEHDVSGPFVDRLVHVERLQTFLAVSAGRVELALHHVILAVHRRQAFLRLDQDQAVHAVADMHADGRGRAMINEKPGIERLERELRRVPRRGEGRAPRRRPAR